MNKQRHWSVTKELNGIGLERPTWPEPRRRNMRPKVDLLMASFVSEKKSVVVVIHSLTGFFLDGLTEGILAVV